MDTVKLNIKQWAEDDRPREKLMQKGASALSNAELLAILIGSGNVDESAVALMKRVLADCDNRLKTLGRMSLEELTGCMEVTDGHTGKKKMARRYKGLGEAKAVTILAACELGRRRMEVEAILGNVYRLAQKHHISVPHMQTCYALLSAIAEKA